MKVSKLSSGPVTHPGKYPPTPAAESDLVDNGGSNKAAYYWEGKKCSQDLLCTELKQDLNSPTNTHLLLQPATCFWWVSELLSGHYPQQPVRECCTYALNPSGNFRLTGTAQDQVTMALFWKRCACPCCWYTAYESSLVKSRNLQVHHRWRHRWCMSYYLLLSKVFSVDSIFLPTCFHGADRFITSRPVTSASYFWGLWESKSILMMPIMSLGPFVSTHLILINGRWRQRQTGLR